jgi:hypothetical protein
LEGHRVIDGLNVSVEPVDGLADHIEDLVVAAGLLFRVVRR